MADTSSVVFGFNTSVLFPASNSFQRPTTYARVNVDSFLDLLLSSIHGQEAASCHDIEISSVSYEEAKLVIEMS